MKVSVIIPVNNRELYIQTAISSLLRQHADADLDIIVVDDGSTDRTADIVAGLSVTHPQIRLVRQHKAGVARARNTGLDNIHSKADLVTFLDSDDICVMGRFAEEIPLFQSDPDLAMTYSRMTLVDDIDDTRFQPSASARTCTLHGISLTTALFRKHALDGLRFDESMTQSEDWDFLLRFFEKPLKYRLVENVSVLYRRHAGNTTKSTDEARRYFIRALLLSAQRRRKSAMANIPKFFDFSELFEDRNAALR